MTIIHAEQRFQEVREKRASIKLVEQLKRSIDQADAQAELNRRRSIDLMNTTDGDTAA